LSLVGDNISLETVNRIYINLDEMYLPYKFDISVFKNLSNDDLKEYKLESLKDSIIQRFEFTLELAWKTLRKYLESEGIQDINSPKQTIRAAFASKVIEKGEGNYGKQ